MREPENPQILRLRPSGFAQDDTVEIGHDSWWVMRFLMGDAIPDGRCDSRWAMRFLVGDAILTGRCDSRWAMRFLLGDAIPGG
ncbi:hypothetical protein [Edaphobacter modestus]|uniref:hypothetical protein n=1 Tax=Edaphobacter modestus TaxID=388466 RepID=UPI00102CAA04|nr:hypothetical protein [Edaphobacter modestus]